MRLKSGRTTGLALAAGAVVAAGCGDEGPSRERFGQEANAICERHAAPIREAAGDLLEGDEQPDPQELRELAWGTLIPEYNEQVGELQALVEPPDELSEEYQRYLDMSASTREEITQDPSVLADAANFEEVNRQAEQLGLSSDCRVGPG
ncbi:MAG: hypothetical protein WKF99_03120 [Solirubrobacteraceae bacterium]|jgi:hypothetical protein